MHEMSLAEGVMQIVEEHARAGGWSKVTAVCLEIGQLAGVEPDAMRFCFDAVARGTVAEHARLEIEQPPGRGWCLSCSREVPVARAYDPCPQCGGFQVQVTGGTGMRVKELEVE